MGRHGSTAKLATGVVLTVFGATLAFASAAQKEGPPPQPAAIRPPPGLVLLLRARAEGWQIYQCQPRAGKAKQYEWVLKGPSADLFDDRSTKIGTHYPGPFWEGLDGSKVRAKVKGQAASPDPHAIPWLLLEATAHEGKGRFIGVKYIQRVDTWAGRAPAIGCTQADAGKEVRVKYQATYLFYGDKP